MAEIEWWAGSRGDVGARAMGDSEEEHTVSTLPPSLPPSLPLFLLVVCSLVVSSRHSRDPLNRSQTRVSPIPTVEDFKENLTFL